MLTGSNNSDDYELPVVTFRMLFLGLGFSAFGYAFKPGRIYPRFTYTI